MIEIAKAVLRRDWAIERTYPLRLVLIVLSTGLLGTGIWQAFADSTAFTRDVVLEQGGTGWQKIQSVFAATRSRIAA